MNQVSSPSTTPIVQGLAAFHSDKRVRHCKIVGTLGPASSDPATIERLLLNGLDCARLNFSHGDHSVHLRNIQLIRELGRKHHLHPTILQDLQGPKIRCGMIQSGSMEIIAGNNYLLRYAHEQTETNVIPVDYAYLTTDIKIGNQVMMNDGLLIFEVTDIHGQDLQIKAIEGGILSNRKGVNFPSSKLSLPAMTEKDRKDLLFGVSNHVDVIALSFVQTPEDIISCKQLIHALGADTPVIAKIEKLSAVENIDAIAQVADGLMVARGDLGVEGGVQHVPKFQRRIIRAARDHAKPVIIATQMLESMIVQKDASMAEVCDVANGVLEGADAVMLSAEVAAGKYPVESVAKMVSIINSVEAWPHRLAPLHRTPPLGSQSNHEAIALAACEAADALQAKAIVCLTLTGSIAHLVSSWRPKTTIIAVSPRADVVRRLTLTWGVYGMVNPLFYNTDIMLQDLPTLFKSLGIVKSGDVIVITAGIPLCSIKPTNTLKINKIP